MSKRYRSNYSLWPQQARPRRALPLTLAAGGFAIGIVCAVAAHNVVTDFTRPSDVQEPVRQTAIVPAPLYASPATAAATDPVEPANRNRSRPAAAKMTLPSIGTIAMTQGAGASTDGRSTDGRGGDSLSGGPATALAAPPPSSDPSPSAATDAPKTAEQPAAAPAPPPKAVKHARRTIKKRQPTNYGYYRQQQPFFGFGGPAYRGYGQVYARQQYYY